MKHILFIAMLLIGIQSHAQFSTPKNVNTLIVVYDSINQDSIFTICRDYLIEVGHDFENIDPALRKMKTKSQAINKWAMAVYSLSLTVSKNRLYIRPYYTPNVSLSFYGGGAGATTGQNELRIVKKNHGVYEVVYEHAEKAAWALMQKSPSHIEFLTE